MARSHSVADEVKQKYFVDNLVDFRIEGNWYLGQIVAIKQDCITIKYCIHGIEFEDIDFIQLSSRFAPIYQFTDKPLVYSDLKAKQIEACIQSVVQRFPTVLVTIIYEYMEKLWNEFEINDFVDCNDTSGTWYETVVKDMKEDQILVHYRGWPARWDEWINTKAKEGSQRINPWQINNNQCNNNQ